MVDASKTIEFEQTGKDENIFNEQRFDRAFANPSKPEVAQMKEIYERDKEAFINVMAIRQNIESSDRYKDEAKIKMNEKDGNIGLDVELPLFSDLSFRIENGRVEITTDQIKVEQLQELMSFFYYSGVRDIRYPKVLDPDLREKFAQAEENQSARATLKDFEFQDVDVRALNKAAARYAPETEKPKTAPASEPKESFPNIKAFTEGYIAKQLAETHRDKIGNYRLTHGGRCLVFFKTAEDARRTPKKDKDGNVKSFWTFKLEGNVRFDQKTNKNVLELIYSTPNCGELEMWQAKEIVKAASANKCTHMDFSEFPAPDRGNLFTACGEKCIIPTNVKLSLKDALKLLGAAERPEAGISPDKLAKFKINLAKQLRKNAEIYNDPINLDHELYNFLNDLDDAKDYKRCKDFRGLYREILRPEIEAANEDNDAIRTIAGVEVMKEMFQLSKDNPTLFALQKNDHAFMQKKFREQEQAVLKRIRDREKESSTRDITKILTVETRNAETAMKKIIADMKVAGVTNGVPPVDITQGVLKPRFRSMEDNTNTAANTAGRSMPMRRSRGGMND